MLKQGKKDQSLGKIGDLHLVMKKEQKRTKLLSDKDKRKLITKMDVPGGAIDNEDCYQILP